MNNSVSRYVFKVIIFILTSEIKIMFSAILCLIKMCLYNGISVVHPPPSAGELVLAGNSTLTLPVTNLQQLNRLFEQHLLSRNQQHGFLALPSHPSDTASLLQLQFLFDVLQKTISLKVILN